MSELHLLDILAARRGCFISDLNLSPILRRAALLDLCRMEENKFPLSQRQRLDKELGFCKPGYAYKSKYPYSHESFYAASPDKECDLFRCVENGKLYLPCTNDLQEYMEQPKKERNRTHER